MDHGGYWNNDLWIVPWFQLEEAQCMSDIHPRRIKQDEVIVQYINKFFRFPLAEGAVPQPGPQIKIRNPKPRPTKDEIDENKKQTQEDADTTNTQQAKLPDTTYTRPDEWFMTGDALIRRHYNPRTALFVPTADDCPIPLKYLDIFRTTKTDLPSIKERTLYDFRTDGNKELSDT